jgi:uncharacterized protein YdiU (UPF0061 family)
MTHPTGHATLVLDDSFAREVSGGYLAWTPTSVAQPRAVRLNHALAVELALPAGWLDSDEALQVLSGNAVPDGAQPVAQAYSGHQFGVFSPVLGDGRALLLGEVIDTLGRRRDIALKGSGRTPFSRGGDGQAALGPVLREYLMGEAMHALGIPTTRALAAIATGESVRREQLLPGAVLTRVAASQTTPSPATTPSWPTSRCPPSGISRCSVRWSNGRRRCSPAGWESASSTA